MTPTLRGGTGTGTLALLGSDGWASGADELGAELIGLGGSEVVVVPTAAAYERPARLLAAASAWFERLGAFVVPCPVLRRSDAGQRAHAELLRSARFIYLAGGSPLHLRSVLKDSTALAALLVAWHGGTLVAGAGAGAVVLSDPMVDPHGGALSVGLGLVHDVAVLDGYDGVLSAGLARTLALAPPEVALVCLPPAGAVLRQPDGAWRAAGSTEPPLAVYAGGEEAGLAALAGKSIS